MSYTEIYKFKNDGNAVMIAEVKNAFRGAMAVWGVVEEKYLPPLPKPNWMNQSDYNERGYSRCSASLGGANSLKEVWDLFNGDKLSEVDKIVLGSTFDNVVVMKNDLHKLVKAFREFGGETSLKEQADVLEKCLSDDDLLAVGWNQTSVNADSWTSDELGKDEEGEQVILPYNINTMDKHWSLFEEVQA